MIIRRNVARVWRLQVEEPARLHCHQEPEERLADCLVPDQKNSGIFALSLPPSGSDLELHHLISSLWRASCVPAGHFPQLYLSFPKVYFFLVHYGFSLLLNGELRTLYESLTCYQVLGSISDTLVFPFAN